MSCRLLAAVRGVARCWRERRKSRPTADRSRSAVQHILEAAVASHDPSGSLGADGGPRSFLHGGVSGKLLRLRQAVHLLASGARQAQRLQSSPPIAPVRRSVRGRGWASVPVRFRPRERRAEVWSSEASAFAWRLFYLVCAGCWQASARLRLVPRGGAARLRVRVLVACARAAWHARSCPVVQTAVSCLLPGWLSSEGR